MKRGALNTNAMPVARTRVGNSSGSHTGIHEYWPRLKNPLIAATTRRSFKSCVHRNRTGVSASAIAKNTHRDRLPPEPIGEETEARIADDCRGIVRQGGIARPLLRRQPGLGRNRPDIGRHPGGDAPPGKRRRQRSRKARMTRRRISGSEKRSTIVKRVSACSSAPQLRAAAFAARAPPGAVRWRVAMAPIPGCRNGPMSAKNAGRTPIKYI